MKKIICTIAVALFIVVAVVILKNEYSYKIPIGNRGIRAAVSEGDLDVLFIGSSTFRSNLDIDQLDEAYDNKDYIIAYGGNQIAACDIQYDEIKSRSNNKYGCIIFELDPLMLTEEVKLSDSRVIWDLSFEGKKKLWTLMKEAGNTDFSVMFEYFVTSGMDDLVTYPITEPFYATRYNKGAKTGEVSSSGLEYLENEEFDISESTLEESQEKALRDLIEKAQKDNQNILFIESPHYYRLSDDPVNVEYRDYFINILKEYNANYIMASDVDFDDHNPEYFEDMGHMSTLGKQEYTKALLEIIN